VREVEAASTNWTVLRRILTLRRRAHAVIYLALLSACLAFQCDCFISRRGENRILAGSGPVASIRWGPGGRQSDACRCVAYLTFPLRAWKYPDAGLGGSGPPLAIAETFVGISFRVSVTVEYY